MFVFQLKLRSVVSCLLIAALGGTVMSAQEVHRAHTISEIVALRPEALTPLQPGTLAEPQDAAAQQPDDTHTSSGAKPVALVHHTRWVLIGTLVAAAGLGIGAAIIAGNSQSGRTAASATTVTINVGPGVTAGTPH